MVFVFFFFLHKATHTVSSNNLDGFFLYAAKMKLEFELLVFATIEENAISRQKNQWHLFNMRESERRTRWKWKDKQIRSRAVERYFSCLFVVDGAVVTIVWMLKREENSLF